MRRFLTSAVLGVLILFGFSLAGLQPTIYSGRIYMFGDWPPGVNRPAADIAHYPYYGYQAWFGTDTSYSARMFCGAATGRGWTFRMVAGTADTTRIDSTGIYTTGNATADTFKGDGSLLTGSDSVMYADSSGYADAAGNALLLQGRDSTDYDDAKTLLGKDTNTIHTYVGRDSAAAQKGDSGLFTRVSITGVSVADTGRMLNIVSIQNIAAPTYYGAGLQDNTTQGFYAGHKTLDSIFLKWYFAGTPDTFQWKMGRTGTYAKKAATTTLVHLVSGCSTKFGATTGHSVNDSLISRVTAPCPLDVKLASGVSVSKRYPDGAVQDGYNNTASGIQSTVSGGTSITASGSYATVGGGNTNTASASYSTVGGGIVNTASGSGSTVGGGESNTASGYVSTVGGGNTNTASASYSTVPGGVGNNDSGPYSFALGCSTRVPATDSFSGVIGFGAGSGWLVGNGKRTLTFGVTSKNFVVYDNDSLVTAGGVKTIHHGPMTVDSALTIYGIKVDSVTMAADTSVLTLFIMGKTFPIAETP